MTALPPAGWFPDPESGGASWRWWDGARWAPPGWGYQQTYDSAGYARTLEGLAATSRNTGKWFRWALIGYAASAFLMVVGLAITLHGGLDIGTSDPNGEIPGAFVALQVFTIPLNLVTFAYFALFIAWLYNAGKFADMQRWPTVRSRTLAAFSPLIPVVNIWWPYEAIRDLYPPGRRPPVALQWWVAHLVVPFVFIPVFIITIVASTAVTAIAVGIAGALLTIPVVLGRRLVDDLEAVQREYAPPPVFGQR